MTHVAPPGAFDTNLGHVVRDRRTALELSQDALAANLSISAPVLRRVEQGLTSLPVADLLRVAGILQIDLHALLQEPQIREQSDASRLVAGWLMIESAKDRRAVLDFLHTLVGD